MKSFMIFIYGMIRCIIWEIPLLIILLFTTYLSKFVIWMINDNDINNKTFLLLLIISSLIGYNCISASSQTGASTETSLKAKQESSQSTISNDRVKLEIPATTITQPDGTIITVGGGKAETNSQTDLQSEQLSKLSAKADATAEATAKSSANITWLMFGLGFLVLLYMIFSVGSKTVLKSFFYK